MYWVRCDMLVEYGLFIDSSWSGFVGSDSCWEQNLQENDSSASKPPIPESDIACVLLSIKIADKKQLSK